MFALKIKRSKYLLLLLGFVVTMFVQLMVITPAQTVFALTPADLKECYDKLDGYEQPVDPTGSGLIDLVAPLSKEKIKACVDAGACSSSSGLSVVKDGKFYTVYSCTDTSGLAVAKATALSAEVAPLIKLYCGTKPTDRLAAVDYRDCSALITPAYSQCRISSFATGLRLLSPIESANCVKQQLRNSFPDKSTAQIQKAIEQGRVASAAVLAAAKDELACTDVGGVFDATKDPPCVDDPAAAATKDECPLPETSMRWLGCSIMSVAQVATDALYGAIQNFLYTPTSMIFDNVPLKKASVGIRNIAIGLILIAGLVMVIAQASGSEIVDAYTIRKLLPRIGVAIIGIALAWPLLRFAITLTNDLGLLADRILLGVTQLGVNSSGSDNDIGTNIFSMIFTGGAVGAASVGAALLGPAGVISLAGTILLAMLLGLFVLAIRQLVIMVCVLIAPLAIAAYVLPGTQKLWGFWKNTFITTLIMFPIIMFFLASGRAFATILGGAETTTASLLAIIVFVAPYFLLPFAFKLAGGLMTTIFSIANDKSRGLFDRGKKFRSDARKQRKSEFASGQLGDKSKWSNRAVQSYAARTALAKQGGFSIGKAGRARFAGARGHLETQARDEALKRDNGYSSGDTDTNDVLQQEGITRQQAIQQLAQKYIASAAKDGKTLSMEAASRTAETSIGRAEASYGTKVGTRNMSRTAYQAMQLDNTSYNTKDENGNDITDWKKIDRDAKRMMASGAMSAADVTQSIKANKSKADRNAIGFGALMGHFEAVRTGQVEVGAEQIKLENLANEGITPGEIMYGHPSVAKNLMPAQQRKVKAEMAVAQDVEVEAQAVVTASTQSTSTTFKDSTGTVVTRVPTQQDVEYKMQETVDAGNQAIAAYATYKSILSQAGSSSQERRQSVAKALQETVKVSDMPATLREALKPMLEPADQRIEVPVMLPNGQPDKDPTTGETRTEIKVIKAQPLTEVKNKLIMDYLDQHNSWFGSNILTFNNEAQQQQQALLMQAQQAAQGQQQQQRPPGPQAFGP